MSRHLVPRDLAHKMDSIPNIWIRREESLIILVTVMFLRVTADDHGFDRRKSPHDLHQPFQPLHGNDFSHRDQKGPSRRRPPAGKPGPRMRRATRSTDPEPGTNHNRLGPRGSPAPKT